jgi:hypothetical protein
LLLSSVEEPNAMMSSESAGVQHLLQKLLRESPSTVPLAHLICKRATAGDAARWPRSAESAQDVLPERSAEAMSDADEDDNVDNQEEKDQSG